MLSWKKCTVPFVSRALAASFYSNQKVMMAHWLSLKFLQRLATKTKFNFTKEKKGLSTRLKLEYVDKKARKMDFVCYLSLFEVNKSKKRSFFGAIF